MSLSGSQWEKGWRWWAYDEGKGSVTFPDAQSRVDIGLSLPTEASLSGSRMDATPLSRVEAQGLAAAEQRKNSIAAKLNHAHQIRRLITPEERIEMDPRGLMPVTIIGKSIFIVEARGGING